MERRARQDTLWALGDLTPEAADVTKHLRDVEGVNFGDYLQRIRLLLDFHRQISVWGGNARVHLEHGYFGRTDTRFFKRSEEMMATRIYGPVSRYQNSFFVCREAPPRVAFLPLGGKTTGRYCRGGHKHVYGLILCREYTHQNQAIQNRKNRDHKPGYSVDSTFSSWSN